MSLRPPHKNWLDRLPDWIKGIAAAITGVIGFALLVRENFQLAVVAAIAVLLATILYGCLKILTERTTNAKGKPSSTYRYARYRRGALLIMVTDLFVMTLLLVVPQSFAYVQEALRGPATPIPSATPSVSAAAQLTATSTPGTSTVLTPTLTPTVVPAPTSTLGPTPLPFAPAATDESLIVIARFHNTTTTNTEPEVKIRRKINQELESLGETKVRVEIEPTVLTADERARAEELGARYGANVMIWGEDTGVETIVHFVNLQQEASIATNTRVIERVATQLANPEAYAKFITEDLPSMSTFVALLALSQTYFLDDDYSRAIPILLRAVESYGEWAGAEILGWANFELARMFEASGTVDMALEYYSQAIDFRIDAVTIAAYNNRSVIYYEQALFRKALADINQAIALIQRDTTWIEPHLYSKRILIHAKLEQGELALEDANHLVELAPEATDSYYLRGQVYQLLGDWPLAIEDFEYGLELDKSNAEILDALCWAHGLVGEPAMALPYCDLAIAQDPQPIYYRSRALAHTFLNNFDAAAADLQIYVDSPRYKNSTDPVEQEEWYLFETFLGALKMNENPFGEAVMDYLRGELH